MTWEPLISRMGKGGRTVEGADFLEKGYVVHEG